MPNALDVLKKKAATIGKDSNSADKKEESLKKEEPAKKEKPVKKGSVKVGSKKKDDVLEKDEKSAKSSHLKKDSKSSDSVKNEEPSKDIAPMDAEPVNIAAEMKTVTESQTPYENKDVDSDAQRKVTKTFTVTKEVIDKLRFISAMSTLDGGTFSISSYVNDLIEKDIDRKLEECGLMDVYLKRKKK